MPPKAEAKGSCIISCASLVLRLRQQCRFQCLVPYLNVVESYLFLIYMLHTIRLSPKQITQHKELLIIIFNIY